MLNELVAPILKKPAPGANTNILSAAAQPKEGGYVRALLQIQVATSSVVNLMVSKTGLTAFKAPINSGNALPAGKMLTFELILHSENSYNFQVETDSVIDMLYLATEKS